jgi:hypothetical protein
MTPLFPAGSIVWAEILDPASRNPKIRPVMLLRSGAPGSGVVYDAVAITSTNTRPLQNDEIELPYSANPQSPSRTGLMLPSVAKLSWRFLLPHAVIVRRSGCVSAVLLREIRNRMGI